MKNLSRTLRATVWDSLFFEKDVPVTIVQQPAALFFNEELLIKEEISEDYPQRSSHAVPLDSRKSSCPVDPIAKNEPTSDAFSNGTVKPESTEGEEFYEELGDFHCVICNQYFLDEGTLDTHLLTHSGENPMVCGFCSERFFDKSSLHAHILTHGSAAKFTCNRCVQHFSSKKLLLDHQRTHHDIPVSRIPENANPLEHKIPNGKILKVSLERVHINPTRSEERKNTTERNISVISPGDWQRQALYCYSCNLNFSSREELERHREIAYDDHMKTARNECRVCGLQFASKTLLISHKRTDHTAFACPVCDKRFFALGVLENHAKSHKTKPFQCTDCDKLFETEKILAVHRKVHAQKSAFACSVCKQVYSNAHNLEMHLPAHNKENRFECGLYKKKFFSLNSLAHPEFYVCHRAAKTCEEMNIGGQECTALPSEPVVEKILNFSQF